MSRADDCWTDHRLLLLRLMISIRQPRTHPPAGRLQRRFDCVKLRNHQILELFQPAVEKYLNDLSNTETISEEWTTVRNVMTE